MKPQEEKRSGPRGQPCGTPQREDVSSGGQRIEKTDTILTHQTNPFDVFLKNSLDPFQSTESGAGT